MSDVINALYEKIAELERRLAKAEETKKEVENVTKKNQATSKPKEGRKYVLLSKTLESWGKVPQQQRDIADLLSKHMDLKVEYTEKQVFDMLIDHAGDYPSLSTSVQDPTYLFRYYRGLKKDAKYGGYVARNFINQVG